MSDSGEYWREHRDYQRKIPKPDDDWNLGDIFRGVREDRKERRAKEFERHHAELKKLGVPYELKNGGHHVILSVGKDKIDFWPASGKFRVRSTGIYSVGWSRLLSHLAPRAPA